MSRKRPENEKLPTNIRRAPNGRRGYQVRYYDDSGKRRTKTCATLADARAELKLNGADVLRGQWVAPEHGRVRFGDWWDQYWATTVNLRANTRDRDERTYRNHVAPTFATMQLGRIDRLTISGWIAELSASGLAPATVQKCHQVLGKALRAAVDADLLAASPAERIKLPRVEHNEMRFLTPNELAVLADTIDPRYRALVLLGGYGGLRIGELLGLRVGRVDVLSGRVHVTEIQTEVRGKIAYGPPKTRAGRRSVPLPRFVIDALAEHIDERGADALVFTSPTGQAVRSSMWRRRTWAPAVKTSGLDPAKPTPLTPHSLRHSAVAFWIAAGASPNEIAARAGHSSVAVVLDRYGHLLDSSERQVTDTLETMGRAAATGTTGRVVPLRRR